MFHRFFESHGRSILKALTWKLIATVTSFSVLYYQTRDVSQSLRFSGTILIIGLITYYLHERVWNGVHWGKQHLEPHDHDAN
jgi:uncharacterized membrane protein